MIKSTRDMSASRFDPFSGSNCRSAPTKGIICSTQCEGHTSWHVCVTCIYDAVPLNSQQAHWLFLQQSRHAQYLLGCRTWASEMSRTKLPIMSVATIDVYLQQKFVSTRHDIHHKHTCTNGKLDCTISMCLSFVREIANSTRKKQWTNVFSHEASRTCYDLLYMHPKMWFHGCEARRTHGITKPTANLPWQWRRSIKEEEREIGRRSSSGGRRKGELTEPCWSLRIL